MNKTSTLVIGGIVVGIGLIVGGNFIGGSPEPTRVNTISQPLGDSDTDDNKQYVHDFTLPRAKGGEISLSNYTGDKPVILDFWASWCHNCQRAMPKTSELYKKYKDQVEVIGINLRESKGKVDEFVDENGISFPIAYDLNGQVSGLYGIRYTNTHVFVNKDGSLATDLLSNGIVMGDINESHFLAFIESNR